jgi:hypothetical protein
MARTKYPARPACYASSVTSSERDALKPKPSISKARFFPFSAHPTYETPPAPGLVRVHSLPASPEPSSHSFDSDANFSDHPLSPFAEDIPEAQINEFPAFQLPPLQLGPSIHDLANAAEEHALPVRHTASALLSAFPELIPRTLRLPRETVSALIPKLDQHAIGLLFNAESDALLSKLSPDAVGALLLRASDLVFTQVWQLLAVEERFESVFGQSDADYNAIWARIADLK